MKFLVSIFFFSAFSIGAYAQYGMGAPGGGGMRGTGMHHRGGEGQLQGRTFRPNGDGNFFKAVLKDSTISGSGSVKIKNGISVLELKTTNEKEITLTPSQVIQLSHATREGMEDYFNYENKYWLGKLNKNVDLFYQTVGETDMVFIKENDKFREATKEDIIDLVKDNKDAYKYARKGDIKKSLKAYIGTEAPVMPVQQATEETDEKKSRPLFNAQ